jgi:thiamine pyrophosphokinase
LIPKLEPISKKAVIIADGDFPQHEIPLRYLRESEFIICCDGSARYLADAGMTPSVIVGDMDSLSEELKERFADRLYVDSEQESNDLTKSVRWCLNAGYDDLVILGATGKREDHSVGNISLLAEYIKIVNVKMVTDTGIFIPFVKSCTVDSAPGQQVSVFSIDPSTRITSYGLLYPLKNRNLNNWWEGTLNEATGDYFKLDFDGGIMIVFLAFKTDK